MSIEFQQKGNPHVHALVWILDAQRISDETKYKSFVEKTVNAVLPDPENEPGLIELVKLYQIHCHSRTCWKYKKINAGFYMGVSFQIEL